MKNIPGFSKLSSEDKVGSTSSLKIRRVNWISWELGTCQVTCSRYYLDYFEVESSNDIRQTVISSGLKSFPQWRWWFFRNSKKNVSSICKNWDCLFSLPSLDHSSGLVNLFSKGYVCVNVSSKLEMSFPVQEYPLFESAFSWRRWIKDMSSFSYLTTYEGSEKG